MASLKITVLRTALHNDLAKQYCGREIERCPYFVEGQEFIVDGVNPPEGFCPWAWQDLFYVIHTLTNGGTFRPWYRDDGVVVAACTDGLRPVTFRVERIDPPDTQQA